MVQILRRSFLRRNVALFDLQLRTADEGFATICSFDYQYGVIIIIIIIIIIFLVREK